MFDSDVDVRLLFWCGEVNIGFFGHLCVRKLRLQEHEHSLEVISTIVPRPASGLACFKEACSCICLACLYTNRSYRTDLLI